MGHGLAPKERKMKQGTNDIEQLEKALKGSAKAVDAILRGPLSRARILVRRSGEGYSERRSLAAARNYFLHGQELTREVASAPREAWASKTHCPIDGTILVEGENLDLGLNYGSEPSRDLLVNIRLLVAAGRLGSTTEDMADRVEEILNAGRIPSDGRFWKRSSRMLESVDSSERAVAAAWIDNGPNPWQPLNESLEAVDYSPGSKDPVSDLVREKLEFLTRELAIASDPSTKFTLDHQIRDARAILRRRGALP
jgi:hypothetical protein